MDNSIISFSFDQTNNIRTIIVDGAPMFVAKDVAVALGYTSPQKAIARHCKNAKSLIDLGVANRSYPHTYQGISVDQRAKIITESDLYRLISNSNLPSAKRFENWIFNEVLPLTKKANDLIKAINNFEIPDDLPDMYVYAIRERETGNVKLGISRDPQQRLRQLQTGNSSTLELVAYRRAENRFDDEHALQNDAADFHIRGEWFTSNALSVM